jgi:hypothetical protein
MATFTLNIPTGSVNLPRIPELTVISKFPTWNDHLMLVLETLSLKHHIRGPEKDQKSDESAAKSRALVTLIIKSSVSDQLFAKIDEDKHPKGVYDRLEKLYWDQVAV